MSIMTSSSSHSPWPENDKKGSLVAVGTMEPIIEVIDNQFSILMRSSNSF